MRKIKIFIFFPKIRRSRVVILITSHLVYVELAETCRPLPSKWGLFKKGKGAALYFIKLITFPFSGNWPVSFFE